MKTYQRILFLVISATLVAFTPFDEATNALKKLNEYRKQAGLPPADLDAGLSKACKLHAEYLIKNGAGKSAHEEDPKLPGYTPEGAKAAARSVIFAREPSAAIDGWMMTFYHRVPLLDPRLKKIGLGYATGGRGYETLLDCLSSVDYSKVPDPDVGVYPLPKQKGLPLDFPGEGPNPLPKEHQGQAGLPVTITFWKDHKVTDVQAKLTANRKEVGCYLSTPEKPAAGGASYQRNTICLFPKAILNPGTEYTVEVSCKVNGKEWTKKWSFTTQ